MECLKCALLEWGPSPGPSLASRNGCPREYHYPAGRQGPVETVCEFMAVPGPNWANRVLCVIVRHRSRKKRRRDFTEYIFESESEKICSENTTYNTDRSVDCEYKK